MLTDSWVEEKVVEEKDAQPTEITAALWGIVANRFKNVVEPSQEWTEAGVKASRATTTQRSRICYICRSSLLCKPLRHRQRQTRLTWLRRRELDCCLVSKDLFSELESFLYSVGNQGSRVWRKGGEAHSQGAMKASVSFTVCEECVDASHLLCLVQCVFFETTSLQPVYQNFKHFMLSSADQLFKYSDFIFQQDLAPATLPKVPKWLNDHGFWCAWLASKLPRPEPHRESMG